MPHLPATRAAIGWARAAPGGRGRGGEGRGLSGRGCRLLAESDFGRPAPGPADRAGSSAWGRPLAGQHASSLKRVGPACRRRPLTRSRSATHSLSMVRPLDASFICRWSGSWKAGSQDAQELAPKDPFQALLGLRPQASPCPTHPLFQRTDSAPVPRVWGRAGSQGGAKTARPVDPD